MALRNSDVDELFQHSEIGLGTEVWITGQEVSFQDLLQDEASALDPRELGQWQWAHSLPISCLFDLATSHLWAKEHPKP